MQSETALGWILGAKENKALSQLPEGRIKWARKTQEVHATPLSNTLINIHTHRREKGAGLPTLTHTQTVTLVNRIPMKIREENLNR